MALKTKTSKLVLAHNHPSGNLQPSNADMQITSKLFEGGKLLDIIIEDHLIVTANDYYSFAEQGLIYKPGYN